MAWAEAARLAAAQARAMATARTNMRRSLKGARNQGRNDASVPRSTAQHLSMANTANRKALVKKLMQHRANLKTTSTGPINGREAGQAAYNAGYSTQLRNRLRK